MTQRNSRELAQGIRSKLFVPGSRPELFAKAAAGKADALSFDLEDSVVATRKAEARDSIAAFLRAGVGTAGKVILVRVNGTDGELFEADIRGVVLPGLHVVNLPKVESAADVQRAAQLMEACERAQAIAEPVGILANIESPKGVRMAYEIASAHPRVVGLQIGFLDMAMACGFDAASVEAFNHVRVTVRLAAAEAGVVAFDGAFGDVKNLDGFRVQAEQASALGMNGKSCIHPSQVAVANEVFLPDASLVEQSVRVVLAAKQAKKEGTGAFLLDGTMIDAPVVERARRVVERAARFGLVAEGVEA